MLHINHMRKLAVRLLSLTLLFGLSLTGPDAYALQIAPVISGWCHTTLRSNNDDLNIRCVSLPKPVEDHLLHQLSLHTKYKSLRFSTILEMANDWVYRYVEVERFINDLPDADAKFFGAANKLITQGKLRDADEFLSERLDSYKNSSYQAEAQYLIGMLRILQFRDKQANQYFEAAYGLQPQNPFFVLGYTEVLIDEVNYPEAQRTIFKNYPIWSKQFADGDNDMLPHIIDALNDLRITYLRIAYNKKADEILSELYKYIRSPTKSSSHSQAINLGNKFFELGYSYYLEKKYDIAKLSLERSAELLTPVCNVSHDGICIIAAKARTLIGSTEIRSKDKVTAIAEFKKAIDLAALARTDVDITFIWQPAVYFEIADAYTELNNNETANGYWVKIADLWKKHHAIDSDFIYLIAHALNELGSYAAKNDNTEGAQKYFEEAQSLSKETSSGNQSIEFAAAVFNLAKLYMDKADMKKANEYSLQSTPLYYELWRAQPSSYSDIYYRSLMILGLSNLSLNQIHMGCENLRFLRVSDITSQWTLESQQSFNQYCIPAPEEDLPKGKATVTEVN